jgi:Astacin (Peptidase family M12A)
VCYFICRFAVDPTKKTLIPKDSTLSTNNIGSQTYMSTNDVQSLNKAYSCVGTVSTNGGGNVQVSVITVFIANKVIIPLLKLNLL